MREFIVIVLSALVFSGCTNPNDQKITALKADVIAVHDEVMPRMGELVDLKSTLKTEWKKANNDSSSSADTIAQIIATRIAMLDSADEAMMSWMADYDPTYDENHETDSTLAYYSAQGEKIRIVQKLMEKAIEDGEKMADYFK